MTAGASGTSTPSRDLSASSAQRQPADTAASAVAALLAADGKRSEHYTSTALAKIRKSLQPYNKDEPLQSTNSATSASSPLDLEVTQSYYLYVRKRVCI